MEKITICQSCGLPFNKEHEHFVGKESDGTRSIYCAICYRLRY